MSLQRDSRLLIYHWDRKKVPYSSHEAIMACARLYAQAMGLDSEAPSLAKGYELAVAREPGGKPYFREAEGIHFSLSHSGDYGVCAVFSHSVGIDIQVDTCCDRRAIAKRFFHPREYSFLEGRGFEPFFDVWAAKESYVKYTGEGIFRGFNRFAVADTDGMKDRVNGLSLTRVDAGDKYKLYLCSMEKPIYQMVTLRYNK